MAAAPAADPLIARQESNDAGGAWSGVVAAVMRALVRPMAGLYANPVKLFRPAKIPAMHFVKLRHKSFIHVLGEHHTDKPSTMKILKLLYKTEGLWSVVKHISPPFLLNAVTGAILFTTYDRTSEALRRNYPQMHHGIAALLGGAAAGAVESLVLTPVDSIRIRVHMHMNQRSAHMSMLQGFKETWKQYSVRGLYRGVGITFARDVVGFATFFGLYETLKGPIRSLYRDVIGIPAPNPLSVLTAGGLAAVAYQCITYPIDVIKSNMFLEAEPGAGFVYGNYRECFKTITQEGGFRFLFSGIGKGLPRAVPPAALGLLVYEYCEHYNTHYKNLSFAPVLVKKEGLFDPEAFLEGEDDEEP